MKVVHCKKEPYDEYIGRGSIFGNPFVIGTDGTRKEVIQKYREWAPNQPKLMEAIFQLRDDDVLGCFCKPQICHGDVIIELFDGMKIRSRKQMQSLVDAFSTVDELTEKLLAKVKNTA